MIDGALSPDRIYEHLLDADEAGVRLEMVMGQPLWELHPSPQHQMLLREIVRSIRPWKKGGSACGCYDLQDVYIKFNDGSFKRPDVSIFPNRPDPTQDALTVVPEAVIEIVSPGSEYKDLEIGPPYLAQGVKDVLVLDQRLSEVILFRTACSSNHRFPVTVDLECGCAATL